MTAGQRCNRCPVNIAAGSLLFWFKFGAESHASHSSLRNPRKNGYSGANVRKFRSFFSVFMARKSSFTTPEEELETAAGETSARNRSYNESPLDARMLDLEEETEAPFLRGQKRVPVRRGALPRGTASRLKSVVLAVAVAGSVAAIWIALHHYATGSWRFRIDSSDDIAITGTSNVSRSQVLEVMASDIDRNVFFVPLDVRRKQLEQIPWVQSASVMRLFPNRLKVGIRERTPVAFIQIDSHIQLIDASGVIMEPPAEFAGQLFVSGHRRYDGRGAALDAGRAHENIHAAHDGTRCRRGPLFAGSERR